MKKKYKFIHIQQLMSNGKPKTINGYPAYGIFSNKSGEQIGRIWYLERMKQYVYKSQPKCVFDDPFWNDVLDFMGMIKDAR